MSALHVVLFYGVIELEDTVETISNSDSSSKPVGRLHSPFSIGYFSGGATLPAL